MCIRDRLRLDRRKLGEKAQKVAVVLHVKTRLFAERLVEQCARELQFRRGNACAELNGSNASAADILAVANGADRPLYLADTMERARVFSNGLIESAFDRVVVAQRLDPRRNKKIKLTEWELLSLIHI